MSRRGSRALLAFLAFVVLVSAIAFTSPAPARAVAGYTPPPMRVGFLWSQTTKDWTIFHRRSWTDYQHPLFDYLQGRGWDVTWVYDADLHDLAKLKQYDVVVLPNVFCIDTAASNTLLRYVAEGGGVVSTLATPRVDPTRHIASLGWNDWWREHYASLLGSATWEWGPLTEAYQMAFVNDPTPLYAVDSVSSSAVGDGAKQILDERGLSTAFMGLTRESPVRTGLAAAGGIEIPEVLKNNPNTQVFLRSRVDSRDSWHAKYPSSYPAGVSSRYLLGRTVYFYFAVYDYLYRSDYLTMPALGHPTGAHQGDVAAAYIESAIAWAGTRDGKNAAVRHQSGARATVNVYRDGMYFKSTLFDQGTASESGPLTIRVFDPAGKLVATRTRKSLAIKPSESRSYYDSWVPGSLASGKYRVELTYSMAYPSSFGTYKEIVYVVRSQGTNIPTVPYGAAAARVGSPAVVARADGNFAVTYTLSAPAIAYVAVLNASGNEVSRVAYDHEAAGYHGYNSALKTPTGSRLPRGSYRLVVSTHNTAGNWKAIAPFTIP